MEKLSRTLILGASIDSAGIGGVTIHLQRLQQWLDKDNFQYDFCDYKKTSISEQFCQIAKYKVVHIHLSHPLLRLVYILYCRLVGTKSILTVHGNIGRFTWYKNLMDKWSVHLCNVPVLINTGSFEQAKKWNKSSILLSAFLPPVDEETLPESVSDMIAKARSEGKIIVASNASVMSFTDAGEEIYGVSFAIEYFRSRPYYFLCISDPSRQYTDRYKGHIPDNVLFITERHSFYALMLIADIMLRPTATDGDSLSVKEGLYLKKKVIATDCVNRPAGVITFHYNDAVSLSKALATERQKVDLDDDKTVEMLINLYKGLASEKLK